MSIPLIVGMGKAAELARRQLPSYEKIVRPLRDALENGILRTIPKTELNCHILIENLTYYLPQLPSDGGRDEIAFPNDLVERSGCGLLLDLYNFHCNAVHFGFDAIEALSRLRLDRVVQIHLAGGTTHDGFVLDVHSDVVPEPVWELLEWTVPRAPHLAGIVYELLEQALPIVGIEGVCRQLERARRIWATYNAGEPDGGAYATV